MENQFDDLYAILDDMNARIEELVNEHGSPEELEIVIPLLNQRVRDFIYNLQEDLEKLDLIEEEI